MLPKQKDVPIQFICFKYTLLTIVSSSIEAHRLEREHCQVTEKRLFAILAIVKLSANGRSELVDMKTCH